MINRIRTSKHLELVFLNFYPQWHSREDTELKTEQKLHVDRGAGAATSLLRPRSWRWEHHEPLRPTALGSAGQAAGKGGRSLSVRCSSLPLKLVHERHCSGRQSVKNIGKEQQRERRKWMRVPVSVPLWCFGRGQKAPV